MPDRGPIAAIALAAGGSRRFGSNKLLYPVTLKGETLPLAAYSLLPWLENFERVTVVVRPGSEAFRAAIEMALDPSQTAAIRWLVCPDAVRGMAASLACGVRANPDAAGWLIGLADMPALPPEAIGGVRKALVEGADLAATVCDGRRGHPVGFAAHYRDELLALQGDAGARHLLERDISRLVQIGISDKGIFADIDLPVDLQSLLLTQPTNKVIT